MTTPVWKLFEIPEVAAEYADVFLTEVDQTLIRAMGQQPFSPTQAKAVLGDQAEAYLASAYRRGIINLEDEAERIYRVNNFYGMLDVFAITQAETYRALPQTVRSALDDWYFAEYCAGLDRSDRPTADEVLPMAEVLRFIEAQTRPVYLNYCDCRSLRGDCGLPKQTCITYKSAPNTFAHRGLSERISKERAKEIVRAADRAGLMHTVNPNGICNCCGDCCYLFRAQRARNSGGVWPKTERIIALEPARCISCGRCTRRCHFEALAREGGFIRLYPERCVGCGICAEACPGGALRLVERKKGKEEIL